eukprot:721104-Pyramimonas_sp.AAC.1
MKAEIHLFEDSNSQPFEGFNRGKITQGFVMISLEYTPASVRLTVSPLGVMKVSHLLGLFESAG